MKDNVKTSSSASQQSLGCAFCYPKTITAEAITPSHTQKGNSMITAEIPREATFELPEGQFRARISNLKPMIKQTAKGSQDWVRLLFEVHIPGLSERINTLAGRSFKLDLNPGSDLRNFLTGLLGKQYFTQNSGKQVSLDSLIGTECEVELEHYYGKGYENPLVVVASVKPVSLIKMERGITAKV